jgi:hypothetical protein
MEVPKGQFFAMAMPLVESAARGQLPDHQFMDEETLAWAASQEHERFPDRPNYDAFKEYLSSAGEILAQYSPRAEWYAVPALAESIHGVRHTLRVLTLATALVPSIDDTAECKPEILVAAALHDLRRLNDRGDAQHGERAAEWWRQNQPQVMEAFALGPVNEAQVYQAIRLHEIPYQAFTAQDRSDYKSGRAVVDVLKTADALDRFRLPKIKWWIDDTKLVLQPPRAIKFFAFRLMVESERAFLTGRTGVDAIGEGIDRAFDLSRSCP